MSPVLLLLRLSRQGWDEKINEQNNQEHGHHGHTSGISCYATPKT
jgi:hypothetical protein